MGSQASRFKCTFSLLQDQYVYCHDLLLEYVDSFEGYSNFNI